MAGLAAGTYFVLFRTSGCSTACQYVPQWYEGALRRADATPIVLSEGEGVTGIDASVSETATIEGHVLNASDSQPATGFEACAFRPGQSRAAACGVNPSEGNYWIGGLTDGEQYVVRFLPESQCGHGGCMRENWDPQYYPVSSTRRGEMLIECRTPEAAPALNEQLRAAGDQMAEIDLSARP